MSLNQTSLKSQFSFFSVLVPGVVDTSLFLDSKVYEGVSILTVIISALISGQNLPGLHR